LRKDYDRFVGRDAEILVIGPEGPRRFRQVWEAEDYPFVGFADYRHTVADLYGQQVKLLKLGRMPALLVVDSQGKIRFAHFGDDMADIPKNDDVLALLDRLNKQEVEQ
jgi:peroxiredoxin Q/BCP